MERKTKELEQINSVTKHLLQKKLNKILKNEKELSMENKDKNLLILQNSELSNWLSNSNNNNKEKINDLSGNENYLYIKRRNK